MASAALGGVTAPMDALRSNGLRSYTQRVGSAEGSKGSSTGTATTSTQYQMTRGSSLGTMVMSVESVDPSTVVSVDSVD